MPQRPINEMWQRFMAAFPKDMPPAILDELRDTFFAGFIAGVASWVNSKTPETAMAIEQEMQEHLANAERKVAAMEAEIEKDKKKKPN